MSAERYTPTPEPDQPVTESVLSRQIRIKDLPPQLPAAILVQEPPQKHTKGERFTQEETRVTIVAFGPDADRLYKNYAPKEAVA